MQTGVLLTMHRNIRTIPCHYTNILPVMEIAYLIGVFPHVVDGLLSERSRVM